MNELVIIGIVLICLAGYAVSLLTGIYKALVDIRGTQEGMSATQIELTQYVVRNLGRD